jgi:hypothetical protein
MVLHSQEPFALRTTNQIREFDELPAEFLLDALCSGA